MLEVDFEKCVDSQEEDSRSCPSAGNGVVQDTEIVSIWQGDAGQGSGMVCIVLGALSQTKETGFYTFNHKIGVKKYIKAICSLESQGNR